MILQADLRIGQGKLILPDAAIGITCNVRTLYNRTRQSYEVVRTIPGNNPYDPLPFPKGSWEITGTRWQEKDKFNYNTYGPVKILTDAHQRVYTYILDEHGDYKGQSGEMEDDAGYWLHWSASSTTLGCIRISTEPDAVYLGKFVDTVLSKGEEIRLEVWR